ncbi:ABC transporter substrate-binding protein [[Clostridium] innocuum]|uniref:ABC transporter substrate-binding protein n=1 Tax=Clostridium innocuum TaxID=1522 RepID=UPI0021498E42|nr:ABC transporter substrate-binding protein [[Clostridium] innocuum]MCR0274164.1 ABC transporter substrate-binding protein [[Clostridium] innocuum]
MKKTIGMLCMLLVTLGFVSGCQSRQEASSSDKTITVRDAKGEVAIPAEPKRIVDLSGNSDILSLLGYSVAGTANSDAYDYTQLPTYLQEPLQGAKILGYSMQDTMDIEGILELHPDLIIISGVQEKMYEQLKKIAPTLMVELAQTDWRQDVNTFARMMQQEDRAASWLKSYDEKAKKAGAAVRKANGEDTTYLALLASGGQLFVFDAAGIGSVLYEDMGLKKPANMPRQDSISLPVISYEGLADLDADHLIVVGTDADMKALKKNSIYKSMQAVKNNRVLELPSSPYFNIGYSSIGRDVFLDEVQSLLVK